MCTLGAFSHALLLVTGSGGGDLYTLGVARAAPTSKSVTPMHASAIPNWEWPFVGQKGSGVSL